MLEVKSVDSGYGRIPVLHQVTFEVPEEKIIALLGGNGAGKTTTLNTISGFIRPNHGTISFDGKRIDYLRPHKITQIGISNVPQRREIFQALTVFENLELGAYTQPHNQQFLEDLNRTFGYFPILKERIKQRAGTLSGGEQQMLAIARGLLSRPRLLMMDEPSTGLASFLVNEIFGVIKNIHLEGTAVLLVEQNVRKALKVAHYVYILVNGVIALSDRAENLVNHPELTKQYLGG